MAAGFYYCDAGTWRTITGFYYNDAGTWRTLTEGHYNDAGTWRKFFESAAPPPTGSADLPPTLETTSTNGNPTSVTFGTTGILQSVEDGTTTDAPAYWLTVHPDAATAALYEIRRTQVSGTLGVTYTGTMTSGVWYPLTSTRGVTVTSTAGVLRTNVSDWDIRLASSGVIEASSRITLSSYP